VKYLKKAARNNNVGSAFLLGMIYFSPDFYQQDFDEADKWLTEAYEKSFKQLPKFIDHMKKTEHFTAANFPDLFDAIEEAPGLLEQPIILAAKAKATKASVQAQVEPDAPDSAQQRTITSAPENENLGDTEVITVVGRLTDLFDIQIASLKNAYPEKGGQSTGTKIIGRSCAETLSCGYANSQAFNQAIDNIAGSAAISSFY